jgi:hypothetical protein
MPEPIGAHKELTALAKDHVFALQLREVLSDSGPRRADPGWRDGRVEVRISIGTSSTDRTIDAAVGTDRRESPSHALRAEEISPGPDPPPQPISARSLF